MAWVVPFLSLIVWTVNSTVLVFFNQRILLELREVGFIAPLLLVTWHMFCSVTFSITGYLFGFIELPFVKYTKKRPGFAPAGTALIPKQEVLHMERATVAEAIPVWVYDISQNRFGNVRQLRAHTVVRYCLATGAIFSGMRP